MENRPFNDADHGHFTELMTYNIDEKRFTMNRYTSIGKLYLLAFLIVVTSIMGCSSGEEETESILVYCGAGMSKPMDEIGHIFLEKNNVEVRYNYAGSNALLNQMELTREGDAYMPGATMYIEIAKEKGLVSYSQLICYHIPVITVPKDNPAGITGLEDLGKPGIR
jgi:ABC-type molybdate transport system substrate-binding protein